MQASSLALQIFTDWITTSVLQSAVGAAQGGMGGGRPPPQKLAVYETKLAKIRLPKIQKIALCRVRPPKMKHVQPPLVRYNGLNGPMSGSKNVGTYVL